MREFTVYRDKWVRGHYIGKFGNSRLLNKQGNMCCLGFMGKACGVSDKRILDRWYPPHTVDRNKHRNYPRLEFKVWLNFTQVNDNSLLTDEERERKLKNLFKEIGWKIKFSNSEPKS